jgi:hypothetical protein
MVGSGKHVAANLQGSSRWKGRFGQKLPRQRHQHYTQIFILTNSVGPSGKTSNISILSNNVRKVYTENEHSAGMFSIREMKEQARFSRMEAHPGYINMALDAGSISIYEVVGVSLPPG